MEDRTKEQRTCFFISPIGHQHTPEREQADTVLRYIVQPALSDCGYSVVRSDFDARPGPINEQILEHLQEDPLVVADISGGNPNVFYELAIRHVIGKPVLQIIREGEKPPFDISHQRTITYSMNLPGSEDCKAEIIRQIHAVDINPSKFESPLTRSIRLRELSQSTDVTSEAVYDLSLKVERLEAVIYQLSQAIPRPFPFLRDLLDRIVSKLPGLDSSDHYLVVNLALEASNRVDYSSEEQFKERLEEIAKMALRWAGDIKRLRSS